MVIGISDRGGDQFGNDQGASTWGNFEGVAAGDSLVLAPAGANAWTFTPGPGGDEFFSSDSYPLVPNFPGQPLHSEITLGHVAHIPGTNEFLFNVMDPAPAFGSVRSPDGLTEHYTESWLSGGLVWLSGNDGSRVRQFMTFGVNEIGTFGKASSVGDVEIICDPAPLQIGNRVFIDNNGNSIQDSGDTAVAGVTLTVYSAAGGQLGRTTTDAFGNWTINFSRGATDPSTNDSEVIAPDPFAQNVFVVVDASNFSGPGALVGYRAVTANADASAGGDGRDSDGMSQTVPTVGTVIAAAYAVGLPGQNDHNIDFGFSNLDFGDLPDIYGTLGASNGPRHTIVIGLQIGSVIDAELDGQPQASALGDDLDVVPDDEEAVSMFVIGNLVAGIANTVPVTVTNTTGSNAQLCGFLDANGNGNFSDAGESVSAAVPTGTNGAVDLSFTPPITAGGFVYLRFRLSTDAAPCSPVGVATDGEVEDYQGLIRRADFGDLPDTGAGVGAGNYNTLAADNGAWHEVTNTQSTVFLGASVDVDADGVSSVAANGDDLTGTDDEDGLNPADLNQIAGSNAVLRFQATNLLGSTGNLCGFIDWNGDGDFSDANESATTTVAGGSNNVTATLNFGVTPLTAVGTRHGRFRYTTSACLGGSGFGGNGEIEDYVITIGDRRDFGDAPVSYATVLANDGARHIILSSGNPQLGATIDAELDGQPNAGANGDDGNGDDEDGVIIPTLNPGLTASVAISSGATGGFVSCWIDYNIDGDFADFVEQAITGLILSGNASTNVTINVPASATAGNSYARCRISSSAVASPIGEAANGEVEDYLVSLGDPLLSLGNLVWEDRNNDGLVDAGEPGINGVEVRLFADANDDNIADGAVLQTTNTNASGIYGFVGLAAGTYLVEITAPANFIGSTGSGLPYVATGSSEPAVDPDNDADNDDNGTGLSGVIRSRSVTLAANDEPINDGDADANSNLSVDFGLLRNFDLALRKQLAAGQPSTVAVGDTVEFVITVFNQGTETASNIQVHDTLPDGLTLADANWTGVPTNAAQRVIAGPLAAGASAAISLFATVDSDATGQLINTAEIALANDSSGQPGNDIDSDPDTDPNNDGPLVDDVIDNSGGDEDDADPASVTVQIAPPPPPLTIPSNNGYALLALLLLIGWSTWRRRD